MSEIRISQQLSGALRDVKLLKVELLARSQLFWLIPLLRDFPEAEIFCEGRACVRVAPRKYGYVDSLGNLVVDGRYANGDRYCEGRALVHEGRLAGFIDARGIEIVKPRFARAGRFSEGLAHVQQNGQWGYIDKTGEIVIPINLETQWASPFRDGLSPLRIGSSDGLFGFIDRSGRTVISPRFRFTYGFSEGLAAVETQDGWGYIGIDGDWAINPKFSRAYPFSEGLAAIDVSRSEKNPEIGYIDKSGSIVIEPTFRFGGCFTTTFAGWRKRNTAGTSIGLANTSGGPLGFLQICRYAFESVQNQLAKNPDSAHHPAKRRSKSSHL